MAQSQNPQNVPPGRPAASASTPSSTGPAASKPASAPAVRAPDKELVYKTTPQGQLKQYVYLPPGWKAQDRRPVIVFFFGGGWAAGKPSQFYRMADYFASRGLVAISVEYRIKGIHQTSPHECVEDARSAIRYVRKHADELGIDGEKLITSGGSAGGHLAASTALCPGPNAADDDLKTSCKPQAMVLFNPVVDLADETTMPALKDKMAISPAEYLTKDCPPMIMFYGDADEHWLPQAKRFVAKSWTVGNRVDFWIAPLQRHAFFNTSPWQELTTIKADEFLTELGYLKGPPTLKAPAGPAALVKSDK